MTNAEGAPRPVPGTIGWVDLTVPHAAAVRDFYAAVVGWTHEGLSMGDYEDYVMKAADGAPVCGVCHARGVNEGVPPAWLVYAHVDDLDGALERVRAGGGAVLDGPRSAGGGRMAVIRDPAGAAFGLYQAAP